MEAQPVANRPYIEMAFVAALIGDGDGARALLATAHHDSLLFVRGFAKQSERLVLSLAARADGKMTDAVRFAQSAPRICQGCSDAVLGLAYDGAGNADSAIAVYRRYVETPEVAPGRSSIDAFLLVPSYKRLGELLEAKGRQKEALQYYDEVLRHWNKADPELQPQVEQVKKAAERLRKAGG
jgi:tetratricopeptide (TPR) repeat protein